MVGRHETLQCLEILIMPVIDAQIGHFRFCQPNDWRAQNGNQWNVLVWIVDNLQQ